MILLLLLVLSGAAFGQSLTPTIEQQSKLVRLQAEAKVALIELQSAVKNLKEAKAFDKAKAALLEECERVAKAQNWPQWTSCNPDTLVFTPPTAKPSQGQPAPAKANP